MRVDELHVTATGVARQGEGGSIESLTGSGLVDYAAMSATAPGVSVAWGGGGKVRITAGVGAVSASALARPSIVDGVLTLAPEQVSTPLLGELKLGELPTIRYRLRESRRRGRAAEPDRAGPGVLLRRQRRRPARHRLSGRRVLRHPVRRPGHGVRGAEVG